MCTLRSITFFLFVTIVSASLSATVLADRVIVDKSDQKLYLLNSGDVIAEFNVKFGGNPKGHKEQEGDEKTPEGWYTLDRKKSDSEFHKAIHISYPNDTDKKAAEDRGVSPGGAIMIHGQRNGFGLFSFITQRFNWTDGCIALTNSDMDKIWEMVPIDTPIEIRE